ncbi:hypothetical protein [Flaviaesturariibacter amylovorans]|uniref:Uncharacterized protein n=1 Tax=Flaviaesturariibacter amylovorans TaxID=1084520 RepID=A0ABP8HVQ8_9BACT
MRTLFLFLSLLCSGALLAQEGRTVSIAGGARRDAAADASWTLRSGTRLLLRSNAEDAARNVATLKRSALKKKGTLVLTYTPGEAMPGWERTITLYTGADQDLQRQTGNSFRLSHKALAAFAKGQKELHLYTMALPTDPNLRSTIRVRRVHLATIKFL